VGNAVFRLCLHDDDDDDDDDRLLLGYGRTTVMTGHYALLL